MQSFKIISNPTKEWARELEKHVSAHLISNGYLRSAKGADFTIVIGGDGTLYYNLPKVTGIVVLIGSETSYRAQLTRTNWKKGLVPLMRARKSVRLPLLELWSGRKCLARAMNDIVFHTSDHIVMNVEFTAGRRTSRFLGDGLIIATAFGSTAYSYSAGGKMLPLNSEKVCVTPICPHLRAVPPCAGKHAKIAVSTSSNCSLMVDGMPVKCPPNTAFTVTVSENGPLYAVARR